MIHVSSGPQIQYKCVNIYCDKLSYEILFYLSDPELRQRNTKRKRVRNVRPNWTLL